jgi:hypothetical protein
MPSKASRVEPGTVFPSALRDWPHTRADVPHGHAHAVRQGTSSVLDAAYLAHPERFVRKPPQPPLPRSRAVAYRQPAA